MKQLVGQGESAETIVVKLRLNKKNVFARRHDFGDFFYCLLLIINTIILLTLMAVEILFCFVALGGLQFATKTKKIGTTAGIRLIKMPETVVSKN
jgi:hypothetical protein